MYLSKVIQQGHGELVVARRPTTLTPAWKYVPCTSCFAFCNQEVMHLHFKNCLLRDVNERDTAQNGLLLLQPFMPQTNKFDTILEGMREKSDHAGNVIKLYNVMNATLVCMVQGNEHGAHWILTT